MKKFCLIGADVSRSFSHIIHRELFFAHKISAEYRLVSIGKNDLPAAVETLKYFDGFNVTKPYKEEIIPYLNALSGAAAVCKSVNTVTVTGGEGDKILTGYSTDGEGFMAALSRCGVSLANKKILLLGAGGVARAIIHAIKQENQNAQVYIYARNDVKAHILAEEFAPTARLMDHSLLNKYDVVVNCTPVGQYPYSHETPLPREYLAGAQLVFDTIYDPCPTVLLSYANDMGIKTLSGFDMLFFQACAASRLWLNRDLPQNKLDAILTALKSKLNR